MPIQTACPGQSCCLCLPKGVECIWETGFVAFLVFSSHVVKYTVRTPCMAYHQASWVHDPETSVGGFWHFVLAGQSKKMSEQRDYIIQKAYILSFHVPTASMPSSKVFFCTMWPYSAKGPYRAVNSTASIDLLYGTLYPFFQRFYSVLNSPGRPLTMHFLQVLSDYSSLIHFVNSVRRTLSYQQTLNGWSSHVSTSARRRMSVWYPSLMWTLFTRMNSWAAPTGSLSRL